MVIYNKGERVIMFSNGVLKPSTKVHVDDAVGTRLLNLYTGELELLEEIIKLEPKVIEEVKEVEKVEEPVVENKPKKKTSRRKK